MRINRIALAIVIVICLFISPVMAQYGDEPFLEGSIAGNFTLPSGYIKNDMVPDSLNAKAGLGFDISMGYYVKNNVVVGLYFDMRNMGVQDLKLHHRGWEAGLYGKYLFGSLSERSFAPYIKLSAGTVFNKFASAVSDNGQPIFRELAYNPCLTGELALGLHWKTNEKGGMFFEFGYKYDLMDGTKGEYESVDYDWGNNNQYITIRAGVLFNIGQGD